MICLIFTDEQRSDAEELLRFLTEEKQLAVHSREKDFAVLHSNGQTDQDCAVILVSNAAVKDPNWQRQVAGIPEDVRLIPVNCALNADDRDPDLVPEKIKEINYIHMDGNHLANIWDSITTEKKFYTVKSMLLMNRSAWLLSQRSDDFLLTNRKKLKQYLLLFQNKLQAESDAYFREELSEIIEYLKLSKVHARKLLREKIKNYTRRGVAAVAAVVCVILFFKLKDVSKRLLSTNVVVGIGVSEELAPVNAVKLVDGITNPFVYDDTRAELYSLLSEHLNMNWHNTPVGDGYKHSLNDVKLGADERYIWSVDSEGKIIKWDTYNGAIEEKTQLSSQPLVKLAVSENEELFITVDFDGYFFWRINGGKWKQSPDRYEVSYYTETELLCCRETKQAALLDAFGRILWFDLQNGFDLIWEGQADKIFCGELTADGLEMVVSRDGGLFDLFVGMNGASVETPIPVEHDAVCSMDLRNGTVLMSDANYQIVTWSRRSPDAAQPAGIVLSTPFFLCFLNDEVIAYRDRNTGTHLYDLTRRLDLGRILAAAPVVSDLSARGHTVAASYAGVCYTENVEALLPLTELDRDDILTVYSEETASSDGLIRQVSIDREYMIRMVFENDALPTIIDSASHLEIGPSQRDISLIREEEPTFFRYEIRPVNFVGKPTVVGITGSGDVLLAGGSDGAFYEVIFAEDGSYILGAQLQIPSHAAITAIYQTSDRYYLEDVTGTLWPIRTGYGALTPEGAVAAVKEKLHYAVSEEIYDIVSRETIQALDVAVVPGGGMREWE